MNLLIFLDAVQILADSVPNGNANIFKQEEIYLPLKQKKKIQLKKF